MRTTRELERDVFRGVNTLVEPIIRAGFGSPRFWPTGLIVLETYGRRSDRTHNIPLLATKLGDLVVVSTVRSRQSQWLKNLAAHPQVRYWRSGQVRPATAVVFTPDGQTGERAPLSPAAQSMACSLALLSQQSGVAFALLCPRAFGTVSAS
jgi:deazaflavin-dependent oxidoreductase (nitroreductase family)